MNGVTGVMTSINGAICCPWPCTTYQEVVSESTVLAALEDEGAEGSEAEAYTPEDEAGETRDPVVLEELFEVDFVELDRGIPKCWDIVIIVMIFFLGGFGMTVLSWIFFFRKNISTFSIFLFLNTKLNIRKRHNTQHWVNFLFFFYPDASTFDFESFRARFSKTLGRGLEISFRGKSGSSMSVVRKIRKMALGLFFWNMGLMGCKYYLLILLWSCSFTVILPVYCCMM